MVFIPIFPWWLISIRWEVITWSIFYLHLWFFLFNHLHACNFRDLITWNKTGPLYEVAFCNLQAFLKLRTAPYPSRIERQFLPGYQGIELWVCHLFTGILSIRSQPPWLGYPKKQKLSLSFNYYYILKDKLHLHSVKKGFKC